MLGRGSKRRGEIRGMLGRKRKGKEREKRNDGQRKKRKGERKEE